MTIDEEQCHVYMLPSMIGVDINVGIAINAKGGYCWIMLSLMSKEQCLVIVIVDVVIDGSCIVIDVSMD
jgi:hypothetical protein